MPADMRRFLASMRGIGGVRDIMSDHSKRMKSILINLRDRSDPSMQLVALQGLAELLSVSTEDTLAGIFNAEPYVKELVNILKGGDNMIDMEGMDDATLAAIMASGGDFGAGNPEMMLLACRCISNLIEAMPSAMGSVVYGGAVPVLCQKLKEIQYIDLAEQALSVS
jgi:E3 ubiquitin-protein ligase TRIP12